MRENTDFPKALSKYLSTTEVKDLEGDGFLLLVEIFQASSFSDVTSDAFVNSLFNSFTYLQNEAIYLAIIHILICISYEAPSLEKNQVLKFSGEHANKRLFAEGVLLLLNKGQSTLITKTLKFARDILHFPNTRDEFFYTNDCRALVDIVMREVGNVSDDELRLMYLNVLNELIHTQFYSKEHHRSGEIKEMLNDCQYIDDISAETQKTIQEITDSGLL